MIARLADLNDADVASLRSKVMATVASAKESLRTAPTRCAARRSGPSSGADGYVRESPWAAVGLAALVGAVVGILVARRS